MNLLRIAFSIFGIFLGVALVWFVDWSLVGAALRNVSTLDVIAGLLIVQVQILLSALRWRFTAQRLGQIIGPLLAISEYYVATAVNQLLPGGVAGDVLRSYRMRREGAADWKVAAKAVMLERLSGQAAFLLFCGVSIFNLQAHLGIVQWHSRLAMLLLALLLLVAVGVFCVRRDRSWLTDLHAVFVRDGAALVQTGLSFVVVCSYFGLFMLCAAATGHPLTMKEASAVIPLCLLSMLIPTGFGGWGTREAAAAALWPLIGLASADGIAASVLYGALAMVGALPGLAVLAASSIGSARHGKL